METTLTKRQPDYKKLIFKLNEETKYFDRVVSPMGFEKVPSELRVEETRKPEQIHSKTILHGRMKQGKYSFFTGLIPTNQPQWFYGDHPEYINGQKKKSMILFQFAPGNLSFTMFFFNHWYKEFPKDRNRFIDQFIQSV